jgi:hypothetical protein
MQLWRGFLVCIIVILLLKNKKIGIKCVEIFDNYNCMFVSKAIFLHTIKAAKRDMLFIGNMIGVLIVTLFSTLMGSVALAERANAKAIYIASSSRIVIVAGLMIFVCFHIKRMFENREIEMLLSRAISRTTIVTSLFAGFVVLAVQPIAIAAVILTLSATSKLGIFLWAVSLLLETVTALAFTMFFALLIESPVFSLMLSISNYIIARVIGSFSAYISITSSAREWYIFTSLSEMAVKLLSIFFPRLDFCAKSGWLVYGMDSAAYGMFAMGAVQCIIFISLLLSATIFDFKRKNF